MTEQEKINALENYISMLDNFSCGSKREKESIKKIQNWLRQLEKIQHMNQENRKVISVKDIEKTVDLSLEESVDLGILEFNIGSMTFSFDEGLDIEAMMHDYYGKINEVYQGFTIDDTRKLGRFINRKLKEYDDEN